MTEKALNSFENKLMKQYYKGVKEDNDRALKILTTLESWNNFGNLPPSVMYSTIEFEIRDRISGLTEEQVEEVAEMIEDYR